MMTRKQAMIVAGAALIAAAGLGTGAAIAASGSPGRPAASAAASADPGYSWYRSMMTGSGSSNGSGMMGNSSYGWMMSLAGYRWMTGGAGSPGWMTGALPPAMMGTGMMGTGTGTDPGKIMGSLFASAPGPRVSAAQAAALGSQVPAGAQVSTADNTITFTTTTVRLTILASPSGGPDETFRAAGLVNPRIVIPAGAHVAINLINADPDTAHGLVVTASDATGSWMPMMAARPAFPGSALWFLGNPASAGLHEGTLTFTATTPGTYHYLCPVPGHAQKGMTGTFAIQLPIAYPMSLNRVRSRDMITPARA
jgi:rusticyanin